MIINEIFPLGATKLTAIHLPFYSVLWPLNHWRSSHFQPHFPVSTNPSLRKAWLDTELQFLAVDPKLRPSIAMLSCPRETGKGYYHSPPHFLPDKPDDADTCKHTQLSALCLKFKHLEFQELFSKHLRFLKWNNTPFCGSNPGSTCN